MGCGNGQGINTHNTAMDTQEFRVRATALNTEAFAFATHLGNMGMFQMNFWQNLEALGGTAESDTVAERGFEWLEENSGMTRYCVDTDFNRLFTEYEHLQNASVDCPYAPDIQGELSVLFTYCMMIYRTVTAPEASLDNFIRNMHTGTSGAMAVNVRLNALLAN
jgi:hypothetical protein